MAGAGPDLIRKRSVVVNSHGTSISLENAFWDALHEIAAAREVSVRVLLEEIDAARGSGNFSSAIRLFVLAWYRDRCPPA